MKAITANGIVLHVADQGPEDAHALVFSNSLGSDFRIWDRVVARLPANLRIIRYDKRGHGLSTSTDAPYSIEDHRGDLADLLDGLGVRQATVVGLSVGGLIGQSLAGARPDLVKSLVLADTAHKIGPPDIWETRIEAISKGGIVALADAILERWFSADFRRDRSDEVEVWRAMLCRTPVEGYLGTCHAIRDADLTEIAKALTVPVVCLVGSEDGATTPALVKSTADLIGADFIEIDGAGHLPCIEAPDEVADVITKFLRETGVT
ncbi:MAG: 3-oxoadipate enol-lactonase [Geminicoccaceae bacterium]